MDLHTMWVHRGRRRRRNRMKDRIKARCERIEKELDAIKQAAIDQEFTVEEMISLNELQHYTAAKAITNCRDVVWIDEFVFL